MEENSLLHNPLRKSLLILVLSFCCTYADLCSVHTCVIADVGSNATLPCGNLTGQDTSQVNWYKNSPDTLKVLLTYSVAEKQLFQLNETKPRIKLLHSPNEDFGLQILQVQQLDAGNYTCKATMNTGVKSTQWELITQDSSTYASIEVGSTVTLSCGNMTTNDTVQVNWLKDHLGMIVSYDVKRDVLYQLNETKARIKLLQGPDKDFGLLISRVQHLDAGNYSCKATMRTGVFNTHWKLITRDATGSSFIFSKPTLIIMVNILTAICLCGSCLSFNRKYLFKVCKKQNENDKAVSNQQVEDHPREPDDIYINSLTIPIPKAD
ncbi:uncharacterized protein LOC120522907 [Polypterus senegalus]|uniref:uncharacterized protein LOC120522907 n=1 Tax=Polypterus senegalus TaxID=55291 RepID=UPI00196340D9|nr:uncharacterized protein LOC120522907 [Polypterus senegalus]